MVCCLRWKTHHLIFQGGVAYMVLMEGQAAPGEMVSVVILVTWDQTALLVRTVNRGDVE